jgi:hypothetical protein
MSGVTWQAWHGDAGSNILECAADVLRLLGHNMPPMGE